MKKLLLSLVTLTALSFASDRNVVIAPQFSSSTLGFSMTINEQNTIRNRMIGKLAEIIPADAEVVNSISAKDSNDVRGVELKLLRYYTEPEKIGKYIGVVTVELTIHEKSLDWKPTQTIVVTEKGQAFWGNIRPFENAIDMAIDEILLQYRRGDKK